MTLSIFFGEDFHYLSFSSSPDYAFAVFADAIFASPLPPFLRRLIFAFADADSAISSPTSLLSPLFFCCIAFDTLMAFSD
jgi:hypothetical protein